MKLRDLLEQQGVVLRRDAGPDDPNNYDMDVRALVDGDWVVYRFWSEKREDWVYKVDPISYLERLYQDGVLVPA